MKTLLKLLLTLMIISCNNDDDQVNTFTKDIIYDAQDNLVYIDNEWLQSIDVVDSLPANDIIGIHIGGVDKMVFKSNTYHIQYIDIDELQYSLDVNNNCAIANAPELSAYLIKSDVFFMTITFIEN